MKCQVKSLTSIEYTAVQNFFLTTGRSRKPMRLNIEVPTAQSIKTPDNLDRRTSIKLDDKSIDIVPEDIESLQELGRGAYGIVEKVRHRPSGHQMAVKVIRIIF